MPTRWTLVLLLFFSFVIPALAQNPDVEPAAAPEPLPNEVLLEGLFYIHQDTNRCSAAALSMHLSYYTDVIGPNDPTLLYRDVIRNLNPYGADASVRIEEMAADAEARGLNAIVRRGGSVDLLRELLAAGFPVLIENVYYDGPNGWRDWLSHNRVAVGYDDARQVLIFYDPLLGYVPGSYQLVEYSYTDVDQRWQPFNRDYLVLYRDDEEETLRTIIGSDWDARTNAMNVAAQAQGEIDAGIANTFTYMNLGWAQVQLELYEVAAASFDIARSMGMPWRMLWYEFGLFEAYLGVGRYGDVIVIANQNIAAAGDRISVEEWYYYAARAYEAQGNLERARINYQVALYRNSGFTEAADGLRRMTTGGS